MSTYLTKDLLTLEDENNPSGSQADLIYPTTIIDQVFDNESNSNKSLRTILEEIRQEIIQHLLDIQKVQLHLQQH